MRLYPETYITFSFFAAYTESIAMMYTDDVSLDECTVFVLDRSKSMAVKL